MKDGLEVDNLAKKSTTCSEHNLKQPGLGVKESTGSSFEPSALPWAPPEFGVLGLYFVTKRLKYLYTLFVLCVHFSLLCRVLNMFGKTNEKLHKNIKPCHESIKHLCVARV
jgi:hypothetical protein